MVEVDGGGSAGGGMADVVDGADGGSGAGVVAAVVEGAAVVAVVDVVVEDVLVVATAVSSRRNGRSRSSPPPQAPAATTADAASPATTFDHPDLIPRSSPTTGFRTVLPVGRASTVRKPMDPDQLLAAVRARPAVDERERFSIELFEHHLPRLERPYDEAADDVHVTGSAIVTGPRGVVLHLHKRLGLWLQPGGHIEAGESPADGALREAREETGLVVRHPAGGPRLVHVDVHPGPKGHTHLDVRFLVEADDDDPAPGADESPDARWFTLEDAIAVADAGLVGALKVQLALSKAQRPPH